MNVHEQHFPGESPEYRAARDDLLRAEIELRRAIENVAVQRRELPAGGAIPQDYAFIEVDGDGTRPVRLSELFGAHDTLVVYSFMYGPEMERPCPACTSILSALDGEVRDITQHVSLAAVAKSSLPRILAFAEERGWRNLRLVSSAGTTYNRDYFGETADGDQMPMLNVFTKHGAEVRHFWGSELMLAPVDPDQNERHVDHIWPLWNVLDCTPSGRGGDWQPSLDY